MLPTRVILLVDSRESIRECLAEHLMNLGYLVFQTENTQEACLCAREHTLHCAIIGLVAPASSQELRHALKGAQRVVHIALSSSGKPRAADCVSMAEPLDLDELAKLIAL